MNTLKFKRWWRELVDVRVPHIVSASTRVKLAQRVLRAYAATWADPAWTKTKEGLRAEAVQQGWQFLPMQWRASIIVYDAFHVYVPVEGTHERRQFDLSAEARICTTKRRPPRACCAPPSPCYMDVPLPVSAKERASREERCGNNRVVLSGDLAAASDADYAKVTIEAAPEKDKDDGVR